MAAQPNGLLELGWQGKFRGLNFSLLFRIERMFCPDIVDVTKEILIPIMRPVTVEDADARSSAIASRDTRLLQAVADHPSASERELAAATEIPRSTIQRTLARFAKAKPEQPKNSLGNG